jgi:hypothetical protein
MSKPVNTSSEIPLQRHKNVQIEIFQNLMLLTKAQDRGVALK